MNDIDLSDVTNPVYSLLHESAIESLARDVGRGQLPVLLAAFSGELERREPLLQAASARGDLQAIARETHSLKGSALTFGALVLGAAARRANDASRAGDQDSARAAICEVLELIPRTREAVMLQLSRAREEQRT